MRFKYITHHLDSSKIKILNIILKIKDPMSNQDKQMEVCETCGAFLIVGDAQSRVDDHLMGKQHMGYAKIKLTIEELLVISY